MILIDLDTFRADRLDLRRAADGGTTPQLGAVASEGLYFPNAFSQAPRTLPSQMSIMTSRYPTEHGVGGGNWDLSDSIRTLSEVFRDAGYQTAAFVDGGWVRARYSFDRGFDLFNEEGGHLAGIVPRALDWLDGAEQRPLFLWIHAYDTHSPYDPPRPPASDGSRGAPAAADYSGRLSPQRVNAILTSRSDWADLADSTVELVERSYDHAVKCADEWVGILVEELRRSGRLDNAILACVSDHGEAFLEHGLFNHRSLHLEVIRVPFFIRLPGAAEARVDSQVVQSIDLAPTLLELAALPIPPGFGGSSLVGSSPASGVDAFSFAEAHTAREERASWSLLGPTHHLVYWYRTGERELYEWRKDPAERFDLCAERTEVADEMQASLLRLVEEHAIRMKDPDAAETPSDISESDLEELKALGYVR